MVKDQVIGIVTNNDDPAKAGRVKAVIHSLSGQEFPDWIEGEQPAGCCFIPDMGESISIGLPEGDDITEFPEEMRYTGAIKDDANPVADAFLKNYPNRMGFASPKDQQVLVDDNDGQAIIKAAAKAILNAPATELSDICTDAILKGTTVHTAFTTFFTALGNAASTLSLSPGNPAAVIAFGGSVLAAVTAIQTTLANWQSTKVRTG